MAVIVTKPANVRDLGPVDATALAARVAAISERAWAGEDARKENDFEVFHHTRHIIFRFTPGNREPEDHYDNPAWMVWRPLLQPVMDAAIRPYGFADPAFPKAMLARLQAGQKIDLHRDGAGSNLRTHKIHVPLITNPGAFFLSGPNRHHLGLGHAWEVNNIASHGGVNEGDADRIHFIFEVFDRAAPAPLGAGAEAATTA
ncbi:aspartyl/asparaginyl beta-hydroxylase domain-containing protein [Sphingopyxis sp. OPL5]|uniref:aspartyl/asparaginyl beta-hydroxylase domain-containing protein n=1 Tax=Sphingopyxis sp. OPL5 TaxID=2486273 RepID=UPI00164E1DAC|nr:aspartyl/asparaginyl beta-hydroxylase domain-containing protein [Sphingopyxis sp. OPL5]QNO28752.1 aspartyl/asparaginyl beta-hydroxylase domain-containing protein [Sphingopyxis sp. OPL5]